jgi:hypothetical protein
MIVFYFVEIVLPSSSSAFPLSCIVASLLHQNFHVIRYVNLLSTLSAILFCG